MIDAGLEVLRDDRLGDRWRLVERPGYFGRKRDKKRAEFDERFGPGNWELLWVVEANSGPFALSFDEACRHFYEHSYIEHFRLLPKLVDWVCTYGECIDNAPTNVESGLDYTKQEAASTHIQDIAVRNALKELGRRFEGPADKILVIRSIDSEGYRLSPGNVPFFKPKLVTLPSKCPSWAYERSVEDFWQSNKWVVEKVDT